MGERTLPDASSRATKVFFPALSLCDLIFSGVFERHPSLRLSIVEFELAWAPHLLPTVDYTYREPHGEVPVHVGNMMRGSHYLHSESTFPQSRKILAEILEGVPDDEQAKPAPDHDPGIAGGNTARVYNFDVARLTLPA